MDTYHISGGNQLSGECRTFGAKNAVLPLLAAAVMSRGECVLYNCPDLSDVYAMLEILETLGCKTRFSGDIISVSSENITNGKIVPQLMNRLRSSVFLMGALLSSYGEVMMGYPGGCAIGERPIDMHLYALRTLGAEINESDEYVSCKASRLRGAEIDFRQKSVGATENAMMAAALADGESIIRNAACEPEIAELQNFLNNMGAKISGAGTDTIVIEGVERLYGTSYSVMPDRIAAGTILAAVSATGGEVILRGTPAESMQSTFDVLKRAGCRIETEYDVTWLRAPELLNGIGFLETEPFPGFPTDLQSPFLAALAVSKGETIIRENIFNDRFAVINELKKMGANIFIFGRTAVMQGVSSLAGTTVKASDLRGGAGLVIAGLAANGTTIVENVCFIDRGYDKLEVILHNLGADIVRINEE